jgi:uncharacterized membrane protein
MLESLGDGSQPIIVIGVIHEHGHLQVVGHMAQRVEAFVKFGIGRDIGIREKQCDVMAFIAQGIDAMAGAGAAAGVQKNFHF